MTDATKVLTDSFVEQHPEDAARLVERRPVDEAVGLIDDLTTAQCAGIIARSCDDLVNDRVILR